MPPECTTLVARIQKSLHTRLGWYAILQSTSLPKQHLLLARDLCWLMAGMGYAQEYHVERYLRECFVPRIAPVSRKRS
ncbi:hypothetical protein ABVK25_009110 [Lepraria finkii]|uniref:Uncharacterized protein n=1 Tax=Lepraria finkii TaxID=1340010 RepID=A0ABR4AY61_9LECA